jgi:predicted Ser/Thr protein kinase
MLKDEWLTEIGVSAKSDRMRILAACEELSKKAPRVKKRVLEEKKGEDKKKEEEKVLQNVGNIRYSEIEFLQSISSGSSGSVYKGIFRSIEVAIKVLERENATMQDFNHEVEILR